METTNIGRPVRAPSTDSSGCARKKGPFCARCRNHRELNRIQGHKRYCKYALCRCTKCLYVKARQVVTANQVKEKRRSAIDEKLRSEGRLLGNSEPRITTLNEELQSLASSTLSKSDVEVDSAILDLFLARIHIDTEAFFEFIKPFIKDHVRKMQVELTNKGGPSSSSSSISFAKAHDSTVNSVCASPPKLGKSSDINVTASNSQGKGGRVSATTCTIAEKSRKDCKLKKEATSDASCVQDKPVTSHFNNLQWPVFDMNFTPTVPTERSKGNFIQLMPQNPFVDGSSILSEEILARYRYLKVGEDKKHVLAASVQLS